MRNITAYFLEIPSIKDMEGFSNQINLSLSLLQAIYYRNDYYYREVEIPKKSGGVRKLACPSKKVKVIQAWILRNILNKISTHFSATAYKTGVNIRRNLDLHHGKEFFLCFDIQDFFTNISSRYVYNLFKAFGYNKEVANLLTRYCTYNGYLPQGGVTSPALSNLINIRLDRRLYGLASSRNISYSRYADDLTFSSNNPDNLLKVIEIVSYILNEEGYQLNSKKTRVLRPGNQRKITGLVVAEDGTVGIGRKKRRVLRSAIYNYTKNQNEEQLMFIKGWLAYLRNVDEKSFNYLSSYSIKIGVNEQMLISGM